MVKRPYFQIKCFQVFYNNLKAFYISYKSYKVEVQSNKDYVEENINLIKNQEHGQLAIEY